MPLANTGRLAGKTLFITGASRGIGKAIALKAAKDGANVVIAAKTDVPHPKLPGTIYTAAEEIEAAGGKALPCVVDVRDEDAVGAAVESAVVKFGGLDILVNNASAIALKGTLDVDMKRYDLMNQINARGTFLCSKIALPHLLKSSAPHILNISPPLSMRPIWFKNHVAYTMAKYGMSMCVLGMAEEFRDQGVGVNALWPKTAIITAAMEMMGGKDIDKDCRLPEIMSDAAYAIFCRDPKAYSGHFAIDEGILREEGMTNFDEYAVDPSVVPMLDFFLDEEAILEAEGKTAGVASAETAHAAAAAAPAAEAPTTAAASPSPASSSSSSGGSVAPIFDSIRDLLNPEIVQRIGGVYVFNLKGKEPGTWYLDLKNGGGAAGRGDGGFEKPDVVMAMTSDNFNKMFTGKLKPSTAFMMGKLKIQGEMTLAIKLEKLMKKIG